MTTGVGEVAHCDLASELNAHLEGNLATEASMVVLDTLELIVQGKHNSIQLKVLFFFKLFSL